jgi:hypothetical protein
MLTCPSRGRESPDDFTYCLELGQERLDLLVPAAARPPSGPPPPVSSRCFHRFDMARGVVGEITAAPGRSRNTQSTAVRVASGPQDVVVERVLSSTNPSQANPDPSSRFRPTATTPNALKGPKMVPHNARTTPMPYVTPRARPIARPGSGSRSAASRTT